MTPIAKCAKCTECARNAMTTFNGLCADCASTNATAPVSAAPWPLTEEHRRMAAEIAATMIDWSHGYVVGKVNANSPDGGIENVRKWIDIATRAEVLSRPWGGK